MIGVNPIVISKEKALEEYNACKEAIKYKRGKTAEMIQLKKLYYHAMKGNKIIDIFEAFKFAGLNDKKEPRLAIARADYPYVRLMKNAKGAGVFYKSSDYIKNQDVSLPEGTFCQFWVKEGESNWDIKDRDNLRATVPVIPTSKSLKKNLANYYILWEVEKWDQVPKDPLLLKRITNNLFVLIDKWNLTKLEQAIIRGR